MTGMPARMAIWRGLQIAEALGEAGGGSLELCRFPRCEQHGRAHLRAKNIQAQWIAADGSDAGEVRELVHAAMQRIGSIEILVNNAGATWGAPAEDHPLDAWDKVMAINIRSVFALSQATARASMIPRKRGRIINVASVAGLRGNPIQMTTIAYNTSKGALVNFTRALAAEWGRYGITVNALAPGFFPSKMTKGLLENWGAENVAAAAPLRRLGDEDDLKGAVVLFASNAGKHITGQVLAIDGGISAVVAG